MIKTIDLPKLGDLQRAADITNIRFEGASKSITAELTEKVFVSGEWFKKQPTVLTFLPMPAEGTTQSSVQDPNIVMNSETSSLLAQIEESIILLVEKKIINS